MLLKKNVIPVVIAIMMLAVAGVLFRIGLDLRSSPMLTGTVMPTRTSNPTQTLPAVTIEIESTSTLLSPTIPPSPTDAPTHPPQPVVLPPTATARPVSRPTQARGTTGQVEAVIGPPTYLAEGRWAELMVTVKNISVASGIQTGYTYTTPNPDGGTQYVTLFSVYHDEVPQAILDPDAPLWRATTLFSNGRTYLFPAGCLYVETVEADGWEPVGPNDGFSWHVYWTGGFFDCGNSTHKIPPVRAIMPGQAATIPLYVYLQHPRVWEDPAFGPPGVRILHVALEVFDNEGRSLGIVATLDLP